MARKLLWANLVVVALVLVPPVLCCGGLGGAFTPEFSVGAPEGTVQTGPIATATTVPGLRRTDPAAFGVPVRYRDLEVTVLNVQPASGNRLVITLRIRNLGSPDETRSFTPSDFRVVGQKGKIYELPGFGLFSDGSLQGEEVFGGGVAEGTIVFEVEPDDSEFVLIWSAGFRRSFYLSLTPPGAS